MQSVLLGAGPSPVSPVMLPYTAWHTESFCGTQAEGLTFALL